MNNSYRFEEIVKKKDGFLRGPFGGDLKKSLFVPKANNTYKVYEQGVVLNEDETIGEYYISKDYFDSKMKKFEVKPGDFLVSCSGVNYGAIYRLGDKIEPGIINQALLRIRIDENIVDPYYFYYYYKYYIVKKITTGTGDSTIPNFPPMSVIKNIEITLPNMTTQKKIGAVLHNFDSKIRNNKKVMNIINNKINYMYDFYFGNYNYIDNEIIKQIDELEFNEKINKELPKSWEVSDLYSNRLCKIIKPGVEYFDKKNYLATGNVDGSTIIDGNEISYDNRETRANMQPVLNSLWFAKMKNSIKHIAVTKDDKWFIDKYILSTGFLGLECDEKSFSYIYSYLNNPYFEKVKDKLAHGATQEAVNNTDLKKIKIIIPSDAVLDSYSREVYPYISLNNNLMKENQSLENHLSLIGPLLMNYIIKIED